jgi:RHS repeat-associated protein
MIDNGAGTLATFRVTTYELTNSEFAAAALTYDLTCNQDLVPNHFVFVRGMVAGATTQHGSAGVRVTHDPFGTGDLDVSSGPRVLRLTRGSVVQGVWSGTVTVVECLGDAGASGFQLVDVKKVVFPAAAAAGEQVVNTTANTAWTSLQQVALYGAWGQGGTSTASTAAGVQGLHAGFAPSGTNAVAGSRWSVTTLPAADATVYVVQWGSEHTLERIVVTGTSGGDNLDTAPEWGTSSVTAHRTQEVFVTATGWTKVANTGAGFTGTLAVSGSGLSPMPDVASTVAVGSEVSSDKKLWVTLHRHPALVAHHVRSATNTAVTGTESLTVAPAGELETYDATAPVLGTEGQRLPLLATSHTNAGASFAQATWSARCSADTTLQGKRITATGAYFAWGTAVDLCRIERPGSTAALHVTRTVLDLLDRPIEVWDARGLAAATWVYAYDARGQRVKAEHTTGTGVRYTLSDAAGNPIWSRDARTVETDRAFDVLNRPLTESSGAGLRRQWTYLAYSAGNTAAKAANLFGRVDEERDQDGLRWFEYDWRGLVTKVSHRFWVEGAAVYTAVDDVVPATARASLSTWLALPGLPDTTTVVVTTVYDAAGRPTSEAWPTLTRTWVYNAAGTLQEAGYNDGTAKVGVNGVTYNARGQVTGWSHGNGLTTAREYDATTERLTRIFTKKPSPEVRFQDLAYAYDPVGNPVAITDQLASSTFTSNNIITNTRRYGYDPRYRLVRSTGKRHKNATDGVDAPNTPAPAATDYVPYTYRYAYDAVGNFTTNQEYTRSALKYKTGGMLDRFDGFGAETYGYDANGNTTSTPRHTSLGYQWDSQPTLVDLGGGGKVRYRRHGDQKVLRFKTTGFRLTLGVWEYENRTAATAFTKTTLHVAGPSGRCAQVEKVLTGADATSLPVFHVHGDHLGSGQCLTKADGTLLCQEEFFAYGRSSDRRDTRNRYRFIGVERDEDTGLCMTGPRTYDPVSGRFLQGDPVVGGAAYVYSRGNPVGRMDPGGYADNLPDSAPQFTNPGDETLIKQTQLGVIDAIFPSYPASTLAENYLYGNGQPMRMAGQSGLDLNPNLDLTWRPDQHAPEPPMVQQIAALVRSGGGQSAITDVRQLTRGATNGGIGYATASYSGVLTATSEGAWSFSGTVQVSDRWDFDVKGPATHRSWSSEAKVMVGAALLAGGTGFEVTTDRFDMVQSGHWFPPTVQQKGSVAPTAPTAPTPSSTRTDPFLPMFPEYEPQFIPDRLSGMLPE